MKTVINTLIAVGLLILAFVVLRGFFYGARYTLAAGAASTQSGRWTIGGAQNFVQGPYTIHGIGLMDDTVGIPAVPYIVYFNTQNATTTKQLVYLDARACAPGAGDAPCVSPHQATEGYPVITTGEHITATGYLDENRFLVTSISSD